MSPNPKNDDAVLSAVHDDVGLLEFDSDEFLDLGLNLEDDHVVLAAESEFASVSETGFHAAEEKDDDEKDGNDDDDDDRRSKQQQLSGEKRPRSEGGDEDEDSVDRRVGRREEEQEQKKRRSLDHLDSDSSVAPPTLASCDSSSSFHTAAHPTTHPTLPPFRPPPSSQMTLLPPHSFTSSPLYARMLENLAESMRRTEESRLYFERHPDAFPPAVDEPSDDGGDAESPASSSSPSPSSSSSESNGAAPPSPPPAPSSSSAAMAGFFDGKRSTLTSGLEWSRRAVRSYAARMGGTAAGWR